jgi:glycosyltransferase involved in cell wall biosynthesis
MLKAGGGQNVAMNFLAYWFQQVETLHELIFLVARDSAPHQFLAKQKSGKYFVAPRNPILRIFFELYFSLAILKKCKVDVIYTYFGFGMFTRTIPQVIGSADSNLYYPEIDFWKEYTFRERVRRAMIDIYRGWCVRFARAVIFENEDMQSRSHKVYGLKDTKYIRPSVNFDIDNKQFIFPSSVPNRARKVLFLCGWQLNKNIMLIPELASVSRSKDLNLHFILTATRDGSDICEMFMRKIADYDVAEIVSVVGSVEKDQLSSLYDQTDCVVLLSKLESFSNNIIEAWYFQRPLIVSSEPWAISICKDAALYVNRDSADEVVEAIQLVLDDSDATAEFVNNGAALLDKYPTIEQRVKEEIEYLSHVANIS